MSHHTPSIFDAFSVIYPSRTVVLGLGQKDKNSVGATSTIYDEMWKRWELLDDLCEGREQMIAKSRRWLPQEEEEQFGTYLIRLHRTFLFGAYSDTLEKLVARPFSRLVSIKNQDLLDESIKNLHTNVDLNGTTLTDFMRPIFKDGIKYGHALALVDFPTVAQNLGGSPLTIAQEQSLGLTPYFVHIPTPNLIGWRTKTLSNGKRVLTQIRYREFIEVNDGEFASEMEERIRVIDAPPLYPEEVEILRLQGVDIIPEENRGTIRIYKKQEGPIPNRDEYVQVGATTMHTYPGIPLVVLPIKPELGKILQSRPPLLELAEQNLAHWQTSSDERNILRFVSIAMLLLKGTSKGGGELTEAIGGEDEVVVGPNTFIQTENTNADGKYIEHSGQGIGSLQKHREDIEARMEQLGMQPLLSKQADVTATAQDKDSERQMSSLQSWIRLAEQFVTDLYTTAYTWLGLPTDDLTDEEGISFNIFSNFQAVRHTTADVQELLKARMAKEISRKTFLTEIRDRGLINEQIDIEEEISRITSDIQEANKLAQEFSMAAEANSANSSAGTGNSPIFNDPNMDSSTNSNRRTTAATN